MSGFKYPRGSEWRKWDLQIHTPFSILNNQFGNSDEESTWDNYVKELFRKAIEKNIAVIGITDYFSVGGYEKIKNDYLYNERKLKTLFTDNEIKKIKNILIFPNIEFRLNKFVGENSINFHVIFSDEVSINDIKENFLHELDFVYEGNPQSQDEKRKLKIENLKKLGEKLKREHPKFTGKDDLFIGMANAVVDDYQILEVLNKKPSIFKGKFLIVIPADEDLSEIDWNSRDHNFRKVLIQKSDILFSSNENTREWALGLKHEKVEDFIKEFKSLKPCIWSSDAHSFDRLFEPDLKRYTWVKADPTFEGLKQIIYEPDERVKIQEVKPEEKRSYFVISKVRFIDNTGRNNFQSDYIELNQNLTSIIGGKSTGKSLLLYYIAKTINQDEVSNRLKDIERNIDIYDFHDDKNFDFEVVWQDGTSQLLKDKKSVSEKNIVYIPQGYLINITEPHKERTKLFESKQAINKFILGVLKQNEEIKKRLETQETEKNKLLKNISSNIDFIMDAKDEINRLKEEISSIGDKEGIKKEIDKLKNDIDSLQKKSGLTSEELQKYNELSEKKQKINEQISNIQSDVEIISELKDYLSDEKENLLDAIINRYFNLLSTEDIKKKVGEIKDSIENFFTDISDEVEKLINYQKQKELKKLQEEISDIDKNLTPYISKLKAEKVLQHKEKLYKEEISKLNKISELEKKIKNNIDAIENKKVSIIENYKKIYNGYKQLANYFKEKEKILGEELLLNLKVGFKEQEFTAVLRDMFIIPDIKKKFGELFDYKEELSYQFENSEKHVEFIEKMVGYVLNNEIKIAKYKYVEETLIKLLGDYFYLDFSITYKGDALEKMSPGKRNLVILKIIIGLSKDKWPILIDQPEDNLDNRSVYEDLVEFVKNSKKNRQIILITHNPNLVVGTDSEEVIVCNQEGQGEDTQKKMYRFEYISGALENSFRLSKEEEPAILYRQGIKQHVCEILEGGEEAFEKREKKYGFRTT